MERVATAAVSFAAATALALAACGSTSPDAARGAPPPAAPTLDAAHAAERGVGGARDYERAVAIYDQQCDGGRGSVEACFDPIDDITDARGATRDLRRVAELGRALCARGEPLGCVDVAMLEAMSRPRSRGRDPADRDAIEAAMKELAAACTRGDGRACEMTTMGGDGSTAEWDRREKYTVACRAGRMDACGNVTNELEMCGEPEHVDDVVACEQRTVAGWRAHDYDHDIADDAQKLFDECKAGDARACEHIPSQRIPMATLCQAHDYGACAELGCFGDDAAAAAARAHGADHANCYYADKKALLEWKRQPHHGRFPPLVSDGAGPIGARPTPPWQAVRFQHHGGRDRADWPRLDVYDLNDHAIVELSVCLYAYDDDGKQLAWFLAKPVVHVAPNTIVPLSLDGAGAPPLPDGTTDVVIDYNHVRFDGGPAADDGARCPAQRPADQQGAYTHW